jgi:UDP-N-acetylmuramate dehydrogenase
MGLPIQERVSLAPFTSFKVGGPARYFCEPASREEFVEARRFARERDLPHFVLGKGTNLIFSDSGYSGLVIYTGKFDRIFWEGAIVRAECGALLMDVVTQSVERGMRGMQNLAGIPGTLGGGVYINAGAFDQELKDVVTEVSSLDKEGAIRVRSNSQCGFAYRRCFFCEVGEIVLEAAMELQPGGDPEELKREMEETLRKRGEKQPLEFPNAGSMFKRPPGNYAGTLIQAAGLKGFRMGNAGISDKHANFTVNLGNATAQEIRDLTSEVIRRVQENSGVTLEREVIFIGDFLPWPR